jgi:antitoxin component of RelBE/YafQ-DinJ toxin-antitoxin module
MGMNRNPVMSYRPDLTERALLESLAEHLGLPLSRVIGLALRRLAETEGVKAPDVSAHLTSSPTDSASA